MDSDDPLLLFWRTFGNWGFSLVILGVLGEVVFESMEERLKAWKVKKLAKWKARLKRYTTLSGWILIIGLGMEFEGHKCETAILDNDNASLYGRSKLVEREAAQANERATRLESANLKLQKELQPRTITIEQITNFIFLTEKVPKIPIKIAFATGRNETANYAYQIREMFNRAGFPADSNAPMWGLFPDSIHITRKLYPQDATSGWPDISLYIWGTNQTYSVQNFNFEETNEFTRPAIVGETNKETIGWAILFSLKKIGIQTMGNADSSIVPTQGDIELYVMDKAN